MGDQGVSRPATVKLNGRAVNRRSRSGRIPPIHASRREWPGMRSRAICFEAPQDAIGCGLGGHFERLPTRFLRDAPGRGEFVKRCGRSTAC
jgi:hypothetical protein